MAFLASRGTRGRSRAGRTRVSRPDRRPLSVLNLQGREALDALRGEVHDLARLDDPGLPAADVLIELVRLRRLLHKGEDLPARDGGLLHHEAILVHPDAV